MDGDWRKMASERRGQAGTGKAAKGPPFTAGGVVLTPGEALCREAKGE